ncbi:unnamed protein product [Amoebophrya sp. A25]|nr:unnamed protein product [Amoebophrya sp. A25]|eukprot:GSA25T00009117001.1
MFREVSLAPPLASAERGVVLPIDVNATHVVYPAGNNVVLRSLDDRNELFIFTRHGSAAVTAVRFAPSGAYVASGDASGKVRVWSTKGERLEKKELNLFPGSKITDIAWDPDSQRLAVSGGGANQATCILAETGNTVGQISHHSKRINSVHYKPSRPFRVATAGEDFVVATSAGPPFKFEKSEQCHQNFANAARYSPDGATLVSCGSDSRVFQYDPKTGGMEKELCVMPSDSKCSLWALSWLSATSFALACGDKTLRIFDVAQSALTQTIKLGDKIDDMPLGLGCAADKADGPLVTLTLSGSLRFFNRDTGAELFSWDGVQGCAVASVATAPDASFAYFGGLCGSLCKMEPSNGAVVARTFLKSPIIRVTVSSGGCVQATCKDQTVRLWDLELQGERKVDYKQYGFAVSSCNVTSSDGRQMLMVVTKQKKLVAIDVAQASVAAASDLGGVPAGAEVTALAGLSVAGQGAKVAVALRPDETSNRSEMHVTPRSVVLFDALTGKRVGEIDAAASKGNITAMDFSTMPDGKVILAVGDDAKNVRAVSLHSWDGKVEGEVAGRSVDWTGFHTSKITALQWLSNADGLLLASGSLDRTLKVWKLEKPSPVFEVTDVHKEGVLAATATQGAAKGPLLLTGGGDGCVKTFELC